jgi:hypothetical protein
LASFPCTVFKGANISFIAQTVNIHHKEVLCVAPVAKVYLSVIHSTMYA